MAYEYESQSVQALKSINSKQYPDTNKDFVANIQRLNASVDYISSYMITMQSGIDSANENIIEQIQGFVQDLIVIFAGGEPTGINIGDLKYIIQALGAMFGFGGAPFPINLLNAAQHFFLGYVVPLEQFTDVIFDTIFAWAEELGLSPDFIDVLRQFADSIVNLGEDVGHLVNTILSMFDIFGAAGGGGTGLLATLWDAVTALLDGFNAVAFRPLLNLLAAWTTPFIQFLTAAINMLDSLVRGVPLNDPNNILTLTIQGILNIPAQLLKIINAVFSKVFTVPSTAISWVQNAVNSIFGWIGGFFNAATGRNDDPETITPAMASGQVAELLAQQAANSSAIAQLQAQINGGGQNSGVYGGDSFDYVNLGGLSSSLWYSAYLNPPATNGYYEAPNGNEAIFHLGSNGNGTQGVFYQRVLADDAHTLTSYQRVILTVGNFTGDGSWFGAPSYYRIWCRLSDDHNNGVFVDIDGDGGAEFGYRVAGADTKTGIRQGGIGRSTGTQFQLIAGTPGDIRTFQLKKGQTIVHSWTDSGAVTLEGPNYKGWGWGASSSAKGTGGVSVPMSVNSIFVMDNAPTPTIGHVFIAYRAATGSIAQPTAGGILSSNTIDTVERIGNYMLWDAGTQKLTVYKAGPYALGLRIRSGNTQPNNRYWETRYYVNGVLKRRGRNHSEVFSSIRSDGATEVRGTETTAGGETPVVYLEIGDYVQPGCRIVGADIFGNDTMAGIVGSADGVETWFTCVYVGGAI